MTVFNQTVSAGCTTTTSVSKSVGKTLSVVATTASTVVKVIRTTQIGGQLYWAFGSAAAAAQRYIPVTQSGSQLTLHNNTPTYKWKAGGIATSGLRLSSTFGPKQILHQALTQALGITSTPRNAIPVSVTAQHLGVHNNAPTVKLAVLIEQFIGLHDAQVVVAKLKQAIVDHLGATGAPLNKLAKLVHESLGLAMSMSPKLTAIASRSGGSVGVHNNVPTVQKFAIASIRGNLQVNQTISIKQILTALVQEVIDLEIALVEPDGGVTTWVINTRTGALSEYDNFKFNSFAQNGLHYMGASDAGLYVLDGGDDDGSPVMAHLRSGYAQFGGSRFSGLRAVYLGMRGESDILFKIDTGDGKSYTYKARVQDQQTTKVLVGKGLRARYIAFELMTEGQDFDLDSIEFVPAVAQRRV